MKHALIVLILLLASPTWADSADEQFKRGYEAYQQSDYATALREWKPLAEQGDAAAQTNLGNMYAIGRGVTLDAAEAVRWYRKAAEQGLASALPALGYLNLPAARPLVVL